MPLRKEDIERIQREAKDYLHTIPLSTDGRYEIQITAYISGAQAEAEKANELVEALEGLVNDVLRKPNDTRYATAINKAKQAISNYKK